MNLSAYFGKFLPVCIAALLSLVPLQTNAQIIVFARSLIQDGYLFKPQKEVAESEFKNLDQAFRLAYSGGKKRLLINIASLSRGELSNAFNQLNAAEIRCKYNLKGDLLEVSQHDQKGNLISATRLRYKKSLVIEEQILDAKRKLFSSARFRYDEQNRLIESEFLDAKGALKNTSLGYAVERRQYDAKGNLTQRIWFDKEKGLSRKTDSRYDPQNNLVEETIFLAEENETEVAKYRYDDAQRWIEKIETDLNQTTFRKTMRKYDSSGNLLEEASCDFSGKLLDNAVEIAKTTFEYQNGKKSRESRFSASGVLRTDMRFDLIGNITERTQYASDGSLIETKRSKYDSYGNLLEENFFKHNAKKSEIPAETRIYEKGRLTKKIGFDKQGNPL
jgi:hypothetical protein